MHNHFQEQEQIFKLLAEMGGNAELQLTTALEIFVRNNPDLVQKVDSADARVDQLDRTINDLCFQYVTKYSPVADDLRAVFAAMKISLHLERIGDYAKNIAIRSSVLDHDKLANIRGAIARMGNAVKKSLSEVLNTISNKDFELALQVWRKDATIDEFYNTIFTDIVQTTTVRPMDVGDGTHLLFIARNMERIGDHIGNIAEVVHFWITGQRLEEQRPYYEDTSHYAPYADAGLDLAANININKPGSTVKKVS